MIYARRVTGNAKVTGYAGYLLPEGMEPKVGSIALERKYGHASVVVEVRGDMIVLHDANWIKGAITERIVHVSTQRGFIY